MFNFSAADIVLINGDYFYYNDDFENGDFLRLQSLALSYDFTGAILDQLGLSDLSVGISGNNLFTITNYSGLDPMIGGADTNFGIDVGNYPVTPSYLLNIRINK